LHTKREENNIVVEISDDSPGSVFNHNLSSSSLQKALGKVLD